MQQPGREVRAEAVAVGQFRAVGLALPAKGAIAPGFLAGIAALPFRPAQGSIPTVHQLALFAPAGQGPRRQLRAAGGAGEQVQHQAGGVITGVLDHGRQGPIQLARALQPLALQPGFCRHQVGQFDHAGGIVGPLACPAGPSNGKGLGAIGPGAGQGRAGIAQPGHRQVVLQGGSPVPLEGRNPIGEDRVHCPIRAVEPHQRRLWLSRT